MASRGWGSTRSSRSLRQSTCDPSGSCRSSACAATSRRTSTIRPSPPVTVSALTFSTGCPTPPGHHRDLGWPCGSDRRPPTRVAASIISSIKSRSRCIEVARLVVNRLLQPRMHRRCRYQIHWTTEEPAQIVVEVLDFPPQPAPLGPVGTTDRHRFEGPLRRELQIRRRTAWQCRIACRYRPELSRLHGWLSRRSGPRHEW